MAYRLDVIIFADTTSEPLAHTLAMQRLAPVQGLYWGNPTTSGHGDTVDFFISGDRLESDEGSEYYSEQLVRIGGQAIWYDPIHIPPPSMLRQRQAFGLPEDAVLYGCMQSTYKFHPRFDSVIGAVLRQVPNSYLVLVQGRQEAWTQQLKRRWMQSIPDVYRRILFLPRAPNSDVFMAYTSCMDALLHPFPFGGSKTSIDGLALGVPVVVLPTR